MWINRDTILDYFQDFYGHGITVDGIKKSCTMLKVYLTPEQIQTWLNKKSKLDGFNLDFDLSTPEDKESLIKRILELDKKVELGKKYLFDKIDYSVYIETLDIYVEKCFKLCELFEMLAEGKECLDLIKYFDITLDGDDILRCDIDRISKPLITNYVLAMETFLKANRYETFLEKKKKPLAFKYHDLLPKDYILNYGKTDRDEFVNLTDKQYQKIGDKLNSLTDREIEEKSENEDMFFVAYRSKYGNDAYDEWLGL